MTPTEREQAIRIASKALDVPNADPDDDLRTVSRQFWFYLECVYCGHTEFFACDTVYELYELFAMNDDND